MTHAPSSTSAERCRESTARSARASKPLPDGSFRSQHAEYGSSPYLEVFLDAYVDSCGRLGIQCCLLPYTQLRLRVSTNYEARHRVFVDVKRYSEEQIIGFLREAHKGVAVKELCRKHGFSEASYYLWRSKLGGMDVSDAKRLKALEAENARLKNLLAESMLENEVTREALRKKW
jgi:putative transposase